MKSVDIVVAVELENLTITPLGQPATYRSHKVSGLRMWDGSIIWSRLNK
jgi:hypothetical protein